MFYDCLYLAMSPFTLTIKPPFIMAKTWLNLFVADSTDRSTTSSIHKTETVSFDEPATVRLFESNRSGAVVFHSDDYFMMGDSEVYLTIAYGDGRSEFLSAPLGTDLILNNVSSLSLAILLPVPMGVGYQAFVNAHVVYEVLGS